MTKAWEMDIPTSQKMVLLALCDHANDDGACYPSQDHIARKCSMGGRSIVNHVNWLKERGILTAERRQKGGNRLSNLYQIDLDTYSKSESANLAHAESAHADVAPTNVQDTTGESANLAPSLEEEPSNNHQLEPSIIADGVAPTPQPVTPVPAKPEKPTKPEADPRSNPDNVACWNAYAHAYRDKYGIPPVSNRQVRGQIATIVRMVGKKTAPALAAYYVSHNDSYFVRERHPIGLLLKNYQRVLTDMQRGEQMTQIKARQTEQTQSNFEATKGAMAILRAKGVA